MTENAIRLAKRYFNEKHLPDAAIDMIDRTMALIKATNDIAVKVLQRITEKISALESSDSIFCHFLIHLQSMESFKLSNDKIKDMLGIFHRRFFQLDMFKLAD